MPFKTLLSSKARAELARRRSELNRLYALATPGLAAELQLLLTAARAERPEMTPQRQVYDSNFLWSILPELIHRIGGPAPSDSTGHEGLTAREFRALAGLYLRNVCRYEGGFAWAMLTNEPCNGNPTVFALDRLCPGSVDDANDAIARGIKEIASVRGTPYSGVWTPAVMVA